LAAILLMGMILASLVVVTGQWLPGWNHGVARLQRTELVALSLERLAGDLAAAEFIAPNRNTPHPLFEGGELFVTFVRTAIGPNTRGGLEVCALRKPRITAGLCWCACARPLRQARAHSTNSILQTR
jgi:general secretion pathway protein J